MNPRVNRLTGFFVIAILSVLVLPAAAGAEEPRYSVPIGTSPAIGPANAPVVLVEFLDYQ